MKAFIIVFIGLLVLSSCNITGSALGNVNEKDVVSCIDDGKLDSGVKDIVVVGFKSGNEYITKEIEDTCLNVNQLREFYCSGLSLKSNIVECMECSDGVCI